MDILSLIQSNLLTPVILFFLLGLIATRVKSDLKIPKAVSELMPIYLLAAIGLHGGLEMKEVGIDITQQKPKELTNQMIEQSITVNMGCMDRESCPALFVKDVIDWKILDPKDKDIDQVRKIRDQIKHHVLDLIRKLEAQ